MTRQSSRKDTYCKKVKQHFLSRIASCPYSIREIIPVPVCIVAINRFMSISTMILSLFLFGSLFTIVQTSLPKCVEVKLKAGTMIPLPQEEQNRILGLVGDPSLFNASDIVRIDRVQFGNDGQGQGQGQSQLNHQHLLHWAWHNGTCNGLRDEMWKRSNGMALFSAMRADVTRLMKMGVSGILREKGSVAIDIGAHSGDSTMPIAMIANHTIAFDPNEDVHSILRINALLNPHLHIDAHLLAVAPEDKEMMFQYHDKKKKNEFQCNGGVGGQILLPPNYNPIPCYPVPIPMPNSSTLTYHEITRNGGENY